MKIFCGCCGHLFRKMDALANHMNAEGYHLKKSKIPGYNKAKFDLAGYLAEHPLFDSSAEVAITAPTATSGACQTQAAAAVAIPSLLRGAPDIYRLPACCLADAIFQLRSHPCSSVTSSVAGIACTTSSSTSSSTTVTTVTPATAPVRSVFTILNSAPTATQAFSAPLTITRDPETPLRDETIPTPGIPSTPDLLITSPPSLSLPVLHLPDHSPAVSNPLVLRTPRIPVPVPDATVPSFVSTVPAQAPVFQSPLSVAYPDTTQAPVIQTLPQYTAFDTLFPQNYFPSVGTMPTSLLIYSLVPVSYTHLTLPTILRV